MNDTPDLTRAAAAALLVQGIEASGLDVDAELDRIGTLPAVDQAFTVQEYQLAALAARAEKLPGGAS